MCYNHHNTQNIMAGVVDHPPASREGGESPAGVAEHSKVELASPVPSRGQMALVNPSNQRRSPPVSAAQAVQPCLSAGKQGGTAEF